jgi:hypothetical protein
MMGSNGRSPAFTSRNRGVVAPAWLFQSGIPADSNSRWIGQLGHVERKSSVGKLLERYGVPIVP